MNAEPAVTRMNGKRRMLIIVNPYATTVSDRLKNLVVYALQGRYEVEDREIVVLADRDRLHAVAPGLAPLVLVSVLVAAGER